MKIDKRLVATLCSFAILLASGWNSIATGLAVFHILMPIPPGSMRLDAMTEIYLISTVLNYSLIVFILCLLAAIILRTRSTFSLQVTVVATVAFIGSMLPAMTLWYRLIELHGPEVNIWKDTIWWYIGG